MKISVPSNCLILVADGAHAKLYRNSSSEGISLKNEGQLPLHRNDGKGPTSLPNDTSFKEIDEASSAKHIADALYELAHKKDFDSLVLIADPQTLGQIRPNLHQEVVKLITGELPKTLTNSTLHDIEKILKSAVS